MFKKLKFVFFVGPIEFDYLNKTTMSNVLTSKNILELWQMSSEQDIRQIINNYKIPQTDAQIMYGLQYLNNLNSMHDENNKVIHRPIYIHRNSPPIVMTG